MISDNLNVGNPLVLESGGPFETWSGGAGTTEDPIISSERVFSPPNSVRVLKHQMPRFMILLFPFQMIFHGHPEHSQGRMNLK